MTSFFVMKIKRWLRVMISLQINSMSCILFLRNSQYDLLWRKTCGGSQSIHCACSLVPPMPCTCLCAVCFICQIQDKHLSSSQISGCDHGICQDSPALCLTLVMVLPIALTAQPSKNIASTYLLDAALDLVDL